MRKKPTTSWLFVLLEANCFHHLYSSKKKVCNYSMEDGDFKKLPPTKNDFYLPKDKLKLPKDCPLHPCYKCMEMRCRFFAYSKGNYKDMSYKEFKLWRKQKVENPRQINSFDNK